MISGLVYTEVGESSDQRLDDYRVKRSLTLGARKVSRMRAGPSGSQISYANKPGRTLLRSIQLMEKKLNDQETDIMKLRTRAEGQETNIITLRTRAEEQETNIITLQRMVDDHERKGKDHEHDIMKLRPLQDLTVDIRKRFFATNRRAKGKKKPGDTDVIHSGNLRAHAGDVCLDVYLFKKGLIKDEDTFAALYGVTWQVAGTLIEYKQLILAMNSRATEFTKTRSKWAKEHEKAFDNLVLFVGIASAEDLERFKHEDLEKDTYHRRLFEGLNCAR